MSDAGKTGLICCVSSLVYFFVSIFAGESMLYAEDRISAVEYEGRKYRSHTLLSRAVAESIRREEALQVLHARPRMLKISGKIGSVFVVVLALGASCLLDTLSGSGPGLSVPWWLAVALVVAGAVGFALTIRLDRLLADGKPGHSAHPSAEP